ncbi:hypothetical protein [Nocardia cyriacigeorgica]|uniref:hypothetical protein n=1 Tax=Nocardia cyriacigeorgica TaxID=135487 RepID=UPI002453AC8A|nr:hypothetical protein [Nocardia cyriacigeorgica]
MREALVTPTAGEPETGLWCEQCALPSVLRFPVAGIVPTGVLDLGVVTICPDCQTAEDAVAAWSPPPGAMIGR